jgi:hypothetical protein
MHHSLKEQAWTMEDKKRQHTVCFVSAFVNAQGRGQAFSVAGETEPT